jgi:hypothetical protein
MRRVFRTLVLGALLAAPAAALAQAGSVPLPQAGTPSQQGVVSGTVSSLNLSTGTVRIRAGSGNWTLNALPPQIADLNPGDVVTMNYENFRGYLWLSMQQSGQGLGGSGITEFDQQAFGQYGEVTGAITGIDKNAGLIAVRGLTFRTHPSLLEGVLPSQFVTAQYVVVGGTPWLQRIGIAGEQQQDQQQ